MDEEVFNMSVRKFLKKVGITSQRELEKAARDAIAAGRLQGNESFDVRVRLETDLLDKPFDIDGNIKLS